jgi:preprotein translocase subunit YajC
MAGFVAARGVAIGAAAAIVRAKFQLRSRAADARPERPENHARDASMFFSPAFAQGSLFGGAGGDSGNLMMSLLPFVLIFVIMYFLILRPQQKRVKQHADMVKNVRRGDTVITNGGLIGKVTKVIDEDQIEIEIADDVRIRQMRQMVSDVRAKGEPVKDEAAAG